MKVFYHLGNSKADYRSIMQQQADFQSLLPELNSGAGRSLNQDFQTAVPEDNATHPYLFLRSAKEDLRQAPGSPNNVNEDREAANLPVLSGESEANGSDLLDSGYHFQVGDRQIPVDHVVVAEQTHSDLVHVCTAEDGGAGFGDHAQIPVADGLLSNIPGLYLLIRTADCTPVLFMDKRARAVGAVHSGREGTRKNIAGKAVQLMQEQFGIAPADLTAYIGAGICAEHYQVSESVWQEFFSTLQGTGLELAPAKPGHIDIHACILQQLIAAGIPLKNIEQDHTCTFESMEHFSFRRDGTHNRQINLIGIEYE